MAINSIKPNGRTLMGKSLSRNISNTQMSRHQEYAKETGPYRIESVVNIPGGQEENAPGVYFVGIDPNGSPVKARAKGRVEDLISTYGQAADSYIGKLFKITKEGEAEIIDNSGTRKILGITRAPPEHMIESTMPLTIGVLFGLTMPNIGDLMSLIRRK
jgi:hypothetical protein